MGRLAGEPARAREGRDERRRRVTVAARALFAAQGFHATGVARIEAASGVRVAQIYRDFGSKEGVIAAIVAEDLDQCLGEEALDRAIRAGDREGLRRWVRECGGFEGDAEECRLMTEIYAEAGRNPRVAEISRAADARVRAATRRAVAALGPGVEPDRLDRLADLLVALGKGVMTSRAVDRDLSPDAVGEQIGRMVDRELDALAG